ncbi:MAG: hypothetical protein GIW97_04625 [Candidatus Eremiobacteraeota bacterium]|nr:hypothetical protein [Candidatus Eremiobacteraeota bacterium]
MLLRTRSFSIYLSAFFVCALLVGQNAFAATTPALKAFDEAWSRVNDYTVTVRAHEVLGGDSQNRVYQFWYKKPNRAKTLIADGDGRGSGGVWSGGDKVSGHQGGFLSHIHLTVDLHDRRAVSLRGYTIPQGLIMNQVAQYKEIKGALSQHTGPDNTEVVELKPASVATSGTEAGVTNMEMFFNKSTHLPVRQIRYAGDKVVSDESWSDLKTNVGLGDGDF